jgi:hypothetical protein
VVKHPHDVIIRAWLDGKPIQYKTSQGVWTALNAPSERFCVPCFNPADEHRIAPPPRPVLRVYLEKNGNGMPRTLYARPETRSLRETELRQDHPDMVWLTDWIEYN